MGDRSHPIATAIPRPVGGTRFAVDTPEGYTTLSAGGDSAAHSLPTPKVHERPPPPVRPAPPEVVRPRRPRLRRLHRRLVRRVEGPQGLRRARPADHPRARRRRGRGAGQVADGRREVTAPGRVRDEPPVERTQREALPPLLGRGRATSPSGGAEA